ncbi:C40 family peptidase [Williamsia sterculiae]|uniref:Cell wall-associated hydrolase, NlpC family n=1 Tax=Williamsia sterculiae TaxID=1344003 RepID=A0A1N7H7Z4_9NOCA|nr:C40 family peptidase [Williamsia sterculiae]SIS20788.1 Cell wall-associated hydrolase, NlpC family [Williamsia sterculiae]
MTGRVIRTVVAAVVVVMAFAGLAGPATAAPNQTPQDLLSRYKALGHDAEKASEAMHDAQIDFDSRSREMKQAAAGAARAQQTLADLRTKQDQLQHNVDALVSASYRGARVNRLYAVLVSDSPQSLLDQMSGLEMVSRQTSADLRDYSATKKRAEEAKTQADAATKTASAAVAAAEKTRADLQARQSQLQMQIAQVKAVYESLTGSQLAALTGPNFSFDPRLLPRGTAAAVIAVQAALTRIGDPYVWGATGPDQFDCSGLMVWAYQQAGKLLPRSSQAQLQSGTAVDRKDLQPGDLIIYYPDATHVGMYVGEGFVIHASTFGVPVKVVPIDAAGPYNSARRY